MSPAALILLVAFGAPNLAILVGACSGGSPPAADANLSDAPATPALLPPPSADAAEREAPNHVTVEYLTGRWCFHRALLDGEAGIIEFDPDGTNRTGTYQVWTQDEYRWDATEDLAGFRRDYPEIVDIEPDRFVGLMRGGHRVVFERAPCR